jgi:hypothetical protein
VKSDIFPAVLPRMTICENHPADMSGNSLTTDGTDYTDWALPRFAIISTLFLT